jgi:hypothetical protein
MKVKVSFEVDINTDAWDDEYGTGSVTEIRSDVKRHIENMVRGQLESIGVLR